MEESDPQQWRLAHPRADWSCAGPWTTQDRPTNPNADAHPAVGRRLDELTLQQLVDAYVAGSPTTALMEHHELGKGTVLGFLHRRVLSCGTKGQPA